MVCVFILDLSCLKVYEKKVYLVCHLILGIVSLPYERFCAILSVSVQNSQTKIKNYANFSDGPVPKRFEIEPSFLAVILTGPSTVKKCFMLTFINHQM